MTRTRPRSHVAYGTGRQLAQAATPAAVRGGNGHPARAAAAGRRAGFTLGGATSGGLPASPRRQAMALLGMVVLCAAILGTVVGHMLSAAPA
jgi:hypothetical protein